MALKVFVGGKTIVLKYGGAALAATGREGSDPILSEIVSLQAAGARLVLVHGGGQELSEMMRKLGKEAVFVDGLRVTDAETMALAEMVLAGRVNKGLVDRVQSLGGRAVGICGKDGGLLLARKHLHRGGDGREADLGFVGEIVAVEPSIIRTLHGGGWIPVVAGIAPGVDGKTYNVNADSAAAALAGRLGADRFILLTDVPGVLADPGDPRSLINELDTSRVREMIDAGAITGGMIPKLEACLSALSGGAAEAWILDGRYGRALHEALFRGKSVGTRIVTRGAATAVKV